MNQPLSGYRKLHLDAHFGEFQDVYFDFDAEACAQIFDEAGFQLVSYFAKCGAGYSYYPTEIGIVHPGLDRDFTGDLTAALKKRGITCIIYFMLQMDRQHYHDHPDWVLVSDPAAAPVDMASAEGEVPMCINSPYVDEVGIPQLEEIVRRYDIDGFFMDIFMHQFQGGKCYCRYCRESFEREVGGPMPVSDDSPNAFAYRLLRNRQMEANMEKVQRALSTVKPDISNIFNWSWTMRYPVTPPGYVDHLTWDPPTPNVGMYAWNFSIEARYLSSVPNITWSCMNTRGNNWGEYSLREPEAFRSENAILLGACGTTYLSDIPYPHGKPDPAVYDVFQGVNARTRDLEQHVEHCTPVREVAVLHSAKSVWAKAPLIPTPEWTVGPAFYSVCGAHKALTEGHVQMEMYNSDVIIDAIHDCRVVILADQVILDDRETEAIKRFVAEGGILIATGGTGTRDVANEPLATPALADVLGVDFKESANTANCYLRITEDDYRFGIPAMDVHIPSGYERVETTTARSLIELVPPYEGISTGTPPPAQETEGPGVTLNTFGKGTALYCAPKLFSAYFSHDTPVLRKLAMRLLAEVYPEDERHIVLQGVPSNVELFYNQRGNERYVHLVNYAGDKRERGVPHAQDFPVIHDISVRVRTPVRTPGGTPGRPSTVTLVPNGTQVPFSYENGRVIFTAKPLHIHSVYRIA